MNKEMAISILLSLIAFSSAITVKYYKGCPMCIVISAWIITGFFAIYAIFMAKDKEKIEKIVNEGSKILMTEITMNGINAQPCIPQIRVKN